MSRLWIWVWGLCLKSPTLRRLSVRSWYDFFALVDRHGEVSFMNYGYAAPEGTPGLSLAAGDEPNRYQIQLYHHVASQVDLRGLDVLEVGSGRGGGAAFVAASHHPKQLSGVDISPLAVRFCQRRHARPNLKFLRGDAENLDWPEGSFDAVLNIESSSHYGHIGQFLSEVARVLRPGGHLLLADIREDHEIPALLKAFQAAGLTLRCRHDIVPGVVRALDLDEARKLDFIRRHAPQILQGFLCEFSGTRGSEKYEAFRSGRSHYLVCLLSKEPPR